MDADLASKNPDRKLKGAQPSLFIASCRPQPRSQSAVASPVIMSICRDVQPRVSSEESHRLQAESAVGDRRDLVGVWPGGRHLVLVVRRDRCFVMNPARLMTLALGWAKGNVLPRHGLIANRLPQGLLDRGVGDYPVPATDRVVDPLASSSVLSGVVSA